MTDIAQKRRQLADTGTQLAFAHLSDEAQAAAMFARYDLTDAHRFSDPQKHLYRAFDLRRATLRQFFGWHVWQRGIEAFSHGHGIGLLAGDGLQMPGVFLLRDGKVLREFRHETAADRPDYEGMASGSLYD